MNFMVKLDLQDAYFSVSFHRESREYVRFQLDGKRFEFVCLCFGLGKAPRIFTKLLKVPISLMNRIQIGLVIYFDNLLIIWESVEKSLVSMRKR